MRQRQHARQQACRACNTHLACTEAVQAGQASQAAAAPELPEQRRGKHFYLAMRCCLRGSGRQYTQVLQVLK